MTDEVITPVPGTPEHEAAMAAKFDAGTGNPPADDVVVNDEVDPNAATTETAERPDWLPEKFKTVEDFVKSHAELEKKLGQPKEEKPEGSEEGSEEDKAKDIVENAGLDYAAMSAEYAENGGLSEETFASLEKAGIPRAYVDQYIAGQEAMVEALQLSAYSVAGGEDNYTAMTAWAATNMTPEEIASYDKAVNSTNKDVVKLAVLGLKGRYEAANGSEPNLEGGDLTGSEAVYESWEQVREAMRDPKYAKDPAYRRQVEQKLGRSNPI